MSAFKDNMDDIMGPAGAIGLDADDVRDCADFSGWSQDELDQAAAVAVQNGLSEKIAPLAEAGANMDTPVGEDNEPLLVYALGMGCGKVALALIENGADVNARGKHGVYPLNVAIEVDEVDIARQLMKHPDIDLHAVCDHKVTPLHVAAEYGLKDIADTLIAAGVDVNAPDKEGITPLHRVCWDEIPEADRSTGMVAFLLEKGADIEAEDKEGYRPLHFAASSDSKELLEFMINKGADITARTHSGMTPLHNAAGTRKLDNVLTLLAHKANVMTKDKEGRTPHDVAKNDPKSQPICAALNMHKMVQVKKLRLLRRSRRPGL